jgi:hypothetical protein
VCCVGPGLGQIDTVKGTPGTVCPYSLDPPSPVSPTTRNHYRSSSYGHPPNIPLFGRHRIARASSSYNTQHNATHNTHHITKHTTHNTQHTDRHTHRQRQRQRQTHTQTDRQTNRQTDRHTDIQTDKHTDRQADGQTHRQTYTLSHSQSLSLSLSFFIPGTWPGCWGHATSMSESPTYPQHTCCALPDEISYVLYELRACFVQ